MKKTVIFLAILFSAATALIAQAHNDNPEKFVNKITQKLELNSAQQEQFRAFISEKRQLKTQRQAHRESKKNNPEQKKTNALSTLFEQDNITAEDIKQAKLDAYTERLNRQEKMLAHFASFYNDLSKEQKMKIKPLMHKMLSSKKKKYKKNRKNSSSKLQ